MADNKLKTAILGLGDAGQAMLKAATACERLQLVAVADKDLSLAERLAENHHCQATDDYRRLVVSADLDCLLVAAPLYTCAEHVRAAIRKGINVLKSPPAGRDFEETAELLRCAEESGSRYAVAIPERFAGSFQALDRHVQEGEIERFSLVTAFCSLGESPYPTWQSDPKLAGGGVLLGRCYGLMDQIVMNFGLPEQVYSLMTNQAHDRQQRLYLTEDTALLAMRFGDRLLANVVASRRIGVTAEQEHLRLYSNDQVVVVSDNALAFHDGSGKRPRRRRFNDSPPDRLAAVLEDFALSIADQQQHPGVATASETLRNMAVMESAYLSARTGFPEEPARILGRVP